MPEAPDSPPSPTRWWLHALLFFATCATTFFVGGLSSGDPQVFFSPASGVMYSTAIMGILLVHEMGHFTASRLHRVDASLPYFIPFPLPPIGTFGAFIRMRKPPRTRGSMLDIGYAGPLAGLVVTIVIGFVGLRLSEVVPLSQLPKESFMEGNSLLYLALKKLAHPEMGPGEDVFLHPVAWAGWLGIIVTSLNLIPAGQLDGGPVLYGLLGPKAHSQVAKVVHAMVFFMGLIGLLCLLTLQHGPSVAGLREYGFLGIVQRGSGMFFWLVWAILLKYVGGEHPPVEDPGVPLSTGRKVAGFATLAVFVVTFTPVFLSPVAT
jgi:membrane-associated protease RseP (regulator of RpoE activity)